MKRAGILAALFSLALFSCSRDMDRPLTTNNASLEGRWRMIVVKDNASGFSHTKPGATPGDVDLTFVAVDTYKGFINGYTPTNKLYADYTVAEIDVISIPSVAATKVSETAWGLYFLDNIRTSDSYSFEEGRLRIHTQKMTLFFEKL